MEKVAYLENSDFTDGGVMKSYVNNQKPVVIMLQGSFCGYCTKAKPDYVNFANQNPSVVVCTVEIDGEDEEKKLAANLTKLDKTYKGVPFYMGFDKNGKFVKSHNGGRDVKSLTAFATTL